MATQLIARVASDYITKESDMLLTPPAGDPRTPEEYTYDMERAGHAYAKPADETPAHLLALRAQIDAETDPDTRRTLIVRLADQVVEEAEQAALAAPGTVVTSRLICSDWVNTKTFGKEIGTDYFSGYTLFHVPDNGTPSTLYAFGTDIEPDDLARDLPDLLTLIADPRVAAHLQTGTIAATPSLLPVTVGRIVPDPGDFADAVPATEFACGEVQIEFLDDPSLGGPTVWNFAGRDCLSIPEVEQAIQEFQRLLSDPRVQALRRGEVLGLEATTAHAPEAPAIRITHEWEEDEEINDEGRGTVAYTNYLLGEDDAKVEVSFPERPDHARREPPMIYMFGRDGIDLHRVQLVLPHLLGLLGDPTVQARIDALGTLPVWPPDKAARGDWATVYNLGYRDGAAYALKLLKAARATRQALPKEITL